MAKKTLNKKTKVLNLLSKGAPVSWTTLRNKFDLTSPRAMVDQLRTEGHMVYINQTSNGTSYRLGTPTKSILAAGASKIFKKSMKEIKDRAHFIKPSMKKREARKESIRRHKKENKIKALKGEL